MSVLVCGGKLTYPIKVSTDKMEIIGVSYVDRLTDYLKYNNHISKIIYLETKDNPFKEEELHGFTGDITMITNDLERYELGNTEVTEELEEDTGELEGEETLEEEGIEEEVKELSEGVINQIKNIKGLEGLRVSDIQWEIMNS